MCQFLTLILIIISSSVREVLGDVVHVNHQTHTFIQNIWGIHAGSENQSTTKTELPVGSQVWLYLMLGIWISCICFFICSCLYCKCEQTDVTTSSSYDSNSFELQEVEVLDHLPPPPPLHEHVKGCACLCCLHRQVALELQLKNEQ